MIDSSSYLSPDFIGPLTPQEQSEAKFISSFNNKAPATTADSPTPFMTGDIFSGLLGGLASGLGQAIPSFLNTSATNLANRITAQPTQKAPVTKQVTTANPNTFFGMSPTTLLLIGGGVVILILLVKK